VLFLFSNRFSSSRRRDINSTDFRYRASQVGPRLLLRNFEVHAKCTRRLYVYHVISVAPIKLKTSNYANLPNIVI